MRRDRARPVLFRESDRIPLPWCLTSLVAIGIVLLLVGCGGGGGGGGGLVPVQSVDGMGDLEVSNEFDFGTVRPVTFHFAVTRSGGAPWGGVVILLASGATDEEAELGRCVTAADGSATMTRHVPVHLEEIVVKTSAVGIADCTVSLSGVTEVTCSLSVAGNGCS